MYSKTDSTLAKHVKEPLSCEAAQFLRQILHEGNREVACHLARVCKLSTRMAIFIGLPRLESSNLYWGALLHDIGKLAVKKRVLHKPTILDYNEYEEIKLHPLVGFELVQSIPGLAQAAEIVLSHHERYDGRGYPQGLKGENIPLPARICAVADTFDAITSTRIYHAARTPRTALKEIIYNSGTQFDPQLVSEFCRMISGDYNLQMHCPVHKNIRPMRIKER